MSLYLHQLKELLNREFTLLDDTRSKILLVSLSATFATIFIRVYNPFDISSFELNTQLGNALSIYSAGIVGASVLVLTQFILRPLFKMNKLSIGTYVLWTSLEFCLICLVIFAVFGERGLPFWGELILTSRFAFYLSLVPYTFSCLLIAVYKNSTKPDAEKKNSTSSSSSNHLVLLDENGKSELILRSEDLIYLKAADNYVQVNYLNAGNVNKKLIRNRLKTIERSLGNSDFIRIHRSHIINKNHIQHINRQGSKLKLRLLHIVDKEFLVTSTYKSEFQQYSPTYS